MIIGWPYVALIFALFVLVLTFVKPRRRYQKPQTPQKIIIIYEKHFKEKCKHEGGYCTNAKRYEKCPPEDPTYKIECWREGFFEDNPLDGLMSVDLGGGAVEGP